MKPAVWLLALLLFPVILPAAECEDTNIYIVETRSGDSLTLIAKGEHCLYATITLTVSMNNMVASKHFPLTMDLNGTNSLALVTLRPDKPEDAWNYRYRFHWRTGGRTGTNAPNFIYTLPYRDQPHKVLQGYHGGFSHLRGSPDEFALDFGMPVGTPVCAARAGIVAAVRQDSDLGGDSAKFKACSNYVIIKHDDGTFAEYYHLKKSSVVVAPGKPVVAGEQLGQSGNTGYSSAPHLHMSVFRNVDGDTRITLPVLYRLEDGTATLLVEGKTY